jgi:hypothetical protein
MRSRYFDNSYFSFSLILTVGIVQFPFFSDCGAACDLHVCLRQDAVPLRSGSQNWVSATP